MKATGPGQPAQSLLAVTELLDKLLVPWAVVGAFAVAFHGRIRATTDGDVTVWLENTSLGPRDLLEKLTAGGFRAELRLGDLDDPIAAVIVVRDDFGNIADLLIGVRGMAPSALARRVRSNLLGLPVHIIGAEDLIAMKIAAGSPKDLDDARGIIEVSGEKLDLALLKTLARDYGAAEARKLASMLKEGNAPG
jgi:hypothetical protein